MRWLLKGLLLVWALTVIQILVVRFVNPPFTAVMAWQWVKGGGSYKMHNLRETWRSLHLVSPYLRKAVLAGEDQRFLDHHGFDFAELGHAVRDLLLQRGVRGASTITMQVARTIFLWPERSWLRKGAEAYYTLLIEIFWDKERILETYLNTVDWGTGIMGAEEAARRYFHASCGRLNPSQAALLAAILPNPHRWSPVHPNSRVLERQKRILRDMKRMPLIS